MGWIGFIALLFIAWLFLTPNGKLTGKIFLGVSFALFIVSIPYYLIIYIFRIYYPNYEGFGVYLVYLFLVIALFIIRFEWLLDKIEELDKKTSGNQTISDEELKKPNRYISNEEINDITKNFPHNIRKLK